MKGKLFVSVCYVGCVQHYEGRPNSLVMSQCKMANVVVAKSATFIICDIY